MLPLLYPSPAHLKTPKSHGPHQIFTTQQGVPAYTFGITALRYCLSKNLFKLGYYSAVEFEFLTLSLPNRITWFDIFSSKSGSEFSSGSTVTCLAGP